MGRRNNDSGDEAPSTKAERDAKTDQRDAYKRLETDVWIGEEGRHRLQQGEG